MNFVLFPAESLTSAVLSGTYYVLKKGLWNDFRKWSTYKNIPLFYKVLVSQDMYLCLTLCNGGFWSALFMLADKMSDIKQTDIRRAFC